MHEFYEQGDEVYVLCQRERRSGKPTTFNFEKGVNVLRVRTGNITKTSLVEKGISTLLIEKQYVNAIKKYLQGVKFDLLIYSTPPITFENVVKHIQRRDRCKSYLLLKDIFPQNAVDIGMLKPNGLLWRYFRNKEKRLYEASDFIGCMSRANVEYVLKHNPEISRSKVEECPNCINPLPLRRSHNKRNDIRLRYGIPQDSVVFIYGGNLGKPQGMDFFLEVLEVVKDRTDLYFLIVGAGTEYDRIHSRLHDGKFSNVMIRRFLPTAEYDELLESCDVGLVFLDSRFTIPNFPSRLTSYMESGLPVVCATDVNTDLKDVIHEAGCGMWTESNDVLGFIELINTIALADPELRARMGLNGRAYLEKHYTVSRAYQIITAHV
ncbi:glycosyltransferase family 4 protein [Paenibacillus terrigena]|uniref:glycosyltransferase family 4 protein n=1 Tax=Paenibacillus terrigena TaxID=369333 RepID=UPI001B7FE904|nr:glycosyltransferase family 4 protein [Paenibacillus terrigena]